MSCCRIGRDCAALRDMMNDLHSASSGDEDMLCINGCVYVVCLKKKKKYVEVSLCCVLHQTDLSWVTAGGETELAASLAQSLGLRTYRVVPKNIRRTQQVLAMRSLTYDLQKHC